MGAAGFRVVERSGYILGGAQGYLAAPLMFVYGHIKGHDENGTYNCHACGQCIVEFL